MMRKKVDVSLLIVVFSGCLVSMFGFGIRSIVGLFVDPISLDFNFSKDQIGLAFALQNLLWGIAQPFAGAMADRFGTSRTICGGAVLYAIGLALMSVSGEAWQLYWSGGILMGCGIAFSSFGLVLGAFARLMPKEYRVLGFGLGTAAGSAGQLFFAPFGQMLIDSFGWKTSVVILAGILLCVMPASFFLRGRNSEMKSDRGEQVEQNEKAGLKRVLAAAFGCRSYLLLVCGFFVCGFHVAFITVYLPSYLRENGISASLGSLALALIGGFNIIGSLYSGTHSNRRSKKNALSFIYFTRAGVILAFLIIPLQPWTVILFSICMGLLWLSTVPPTNGLVLTMFGPRYLSTLFGIVFFSHQIGSFLGVYLGGLGYELFGNYDVVWYLGIFFGVLSALVHLPIREQAVPVPA